MRALFLTLFIAPYLAFGAVSESEILACGNIDIDASRLSCFDNLADKIRPPSATGASNTADTGIWEVTYFVDNFGDPTDSGYIRNKALISGVFSNSATQNSRLLVRILIPDASSVSIMLYEYGGNNPVKAYSRTRYRVLIQDSAGERLTLNAYNSSDRLTLTNNDSKFVHNALLKGGRVLFRISEYDTPITQYSFEISNANFYENAYNILQGDLP